MARCFCDCAKPTTSFYIWYRINRYHLSSIDQKVGKSRLCMTKKRLQEINCASGQHRKDKSSAHAKSMSTIRCVCGSEILVVPDLKAMNRAIKNHVAEHKQASYDSALDSLEQFLTEQVLIVASEISLPNAN